jgi:hypothetical protein
MERQSRRTGTSRRGRDSGMPPRRVTTLVSTASVVLCHHRRMDGFGVIVGAGSLRSPAAVNTFAHRWTEEGVTVVSEFTGGHLLHLAAAGCVLNDTYREAAGMGLHLRGVRVGANGAFDESTWQSTGIEYWVEIDSDAQLPELAALLLRVDEVAEIPRSIRAGASVDRVPAVFDSTGQ